jgi:hypothetical protein
MAAAWVLIGTRPERSYGDTLFSRLATVYSLTEYGRWSIADPAIGLSNPFESRTADKVEINGRILSSKPPLLPILMTSELLALRPATGWLLDDPSDPKRAAWILTLTWSGVPFVIMTLCVWLTARLCLPGRAAAPAFLALAAAAGTQAAAYATVFNNHVIAAASVAACFYFALRLREKANWAEFVLFGLSAGLCATMDVPTAIYPALLGAWLARTRLPGLLIFALPAAALLIAIQTVALIAATGSPLPVQMHREWYLYENSYWRNPGGVDALADPKGVYLFHITLGRAGLFSLFPVTLLGLAGLITALRSSEPRMKAVAVTGAAGSAVLLGYYALTTNNYGGEAFGFRWSIAAGPVLLLMAVPAMATVKRGWQWGIAGLLLAISAFSAYQGAQHPWESDREWTTKVFGKRL